MTAAVFLLPMANVGPDNDKVTPGTWGFVIVACLATATWFLIRSMLKQLRKIDPRTAEVETPEPAVEEQTEIGADGR